MSNLGDNIIYSLIVTLFGVGIVFVVLVLLQYILKAMEAVFHKEKKTVADVAPVVEVKASEPAARQVNAVEAEDDDQLVAVITAAVISCLGGNSNIVVRNIRRVNDVTPAWGKVSRTEQMSNRL